MTTAIAPGAPKSKAENRDPKRVSKEQFLSEYVEREDGVNYKLKNGAVEKTKGPLPKPPRRVSRAVFLRDYANREDGYKYEFNDGIIEKTERMNQQQSKFFYRLFQIFLKTVAAQKGGMLINETDMDTSSVQERRPDISFYNVELLPLMWEGKKQVTPWPAEVISPSDEASKINKKLDEYFRAGVQVVWHIHPESQKVEVFTSPDDVKICRGKTICSGSPALPDFEISAEELFA